MGKIANGVATGVNVVAKLLVTALWVAVAIAGFATGAWPIGLLAIAYLIYLWVFSGRWLIY